MKGYVSNCDIQREIYTLRDWWPGRPASLWFSHRAAVYRFEPVSLPLIGYVRRFIGEQDLWARPRFSSFSGSSNFDSFRDERLVAVQLLLCGVLPLGLVQNCSQHSCVVSVKLFLHHNHPDYFTKIPGKGVMKIPFDNYQDRYKNRQKLEEKNQRGIIIEYDRSIVVYMSFSFIRTCIMKC